MSKQEVVCNRPCWDSSTATYYTFGNVALIDPKTPIAQHFDGWAPGTIVYHKERGVLGGKEPQVTTRKVAESFSGKIDKAADVKGEKIADVKKEKSTPPDDQDIF